MWGLEYVCKWAMNGLFLSKAIYLHLIKPKQWIIIDTQTQQKQKSRNVTKHEDVWYLQFVNSFMIRNFLRITKCNGYIRFELSECYNRGLIMWLKNTVYSYEYLPQSVIKEGKCTITVLNTTTSTDKGYYIKTNCKRYHVWI